MKGQSSIEFLAVVGLGVLMAAPFIVQAQDSVIEVSQGSETAEFSSSFEALGDAIDQVAAMGEPAKRTVRLDIPRNMDSINVVGDNALVFTRNRSGQPTNYTSIHDTQLYVENIPIRRGSYRIEVEAWNNQVNLSRK